jgi:hypothetical protein
MISNKNGGPAFPVHSELKDDEPHAGMSLRDYFAAKVLVGLISGDIGWHACEESYVAERAYSIADAMLSERAT